MNGNERALVTEARANVRIARADPTAVWPPNALETAEARLTQALEGGPDTPAMTAEERALVLDGRANVRIVRAEGDAAPPEIRWVVPARIRRRRVFDLDDARTEAGEPERRERSGEGDREIEDREAGERTAFSLNRSLREHTRVGVYRRGEPPPKTLSEEL